MQQAYVIAGTLVLVGVVLAVLLTRVRWAVSSPAEELLEPEQERLARRLAEVRIDLAELLGDAGKLALRSYEQALMAGEGSVNQIELLNKLATACQASSGQRTALDEFLAVLEKINQQCLLRQTLFKIYYRSLGLGWAGVDVATVTSGQMVKYQGLIAKVVAKLYAVAPTHGLIRLACERNEADTREEFIATFGNPMFTRVEQDTWQAEVYMNLLLLVTLTQALEHPDQTVTVDHYQMILVACQGVEVAQDPCLITPVSL